MHNDEKRSHTMTLDELRTAGLAVAEQLKSAANAAEAPAATGGGSLHRALPPDVRARFIEVRANLFQRGFFDPVLVRFDTATAPQAPTAEIAERLIQVVSAL